VTAVTTNRFAPAPSPARLFAIELRKTIDTRAGFWLLVANALAAIGVAAITLAAHDHQQPTFGLFFERTIGTGSIALPVLGILAITSEWSQRTAITTFALVPRRERVIAAKLLAGVALALAFVAVCLLTSLAATALVPVLTDGVARWDIAGAGVAAAVTFTVMWMLAGAALGLLVMSSAPAIVLSFLIPTGIIGLNTALPDAHGVLDWIDLGTTGGELNAAHPAISAQDWAHLATGVALWVLIPLALGFVRLHRREVTAAA
jgi:ABC-2 type transport system permease protein